MAFFIFVLADVIHFIKIVVACDMCTSFKRRKFIDNRLLTVISCLIVAGVSAFIYVFDNHIIETFIYVFVIILMMLMLYKEKIHIISMVVMWILFALSMIDIMVGTLYDILMKLFELNGDIISNVVVSSVSLIMIFLMGRAYRKNNTATLNSMGVVNIIGFTILLAIDTFVVTTIIAQPFVDSHIGSKRNIYLLAVVFVIIGIFIQLASVILLFTQRNVYKEKEEITDRYLNEQKNHYEYLENREKETKKFRHDLRSHMEMISNLAKNNEYEEIDAYLEQMHIKIDSFGNMVTVQNGIVDAIINQYYMKAMQSGVKMEVKGRFPVDCSIDAFDLCTIFSNVLSNALEAAAETEEKYISLECGYTDKNIIIVVENSFCEDAKSGNSLWTTRKANKDYHGYGLENINDSVNKYDGVFDIEPKGNRFILKILFHNVGK